jgi:hypothetical protein
MKHLLVSFFALPLVACVGTRNLADPVLEIRGPEASELGVATDYGLVFLGRSARAGAVEVIAWYGDGPSMEQRWSSRSAAGCTRRARDQVATRSAELRESKLGETLFIVGRRGPELWAAQVEVRHDPQIEGVLLTIPKGLENGPDQIGAGLYRANPTTWRRSNWSA